MPIKRGVPILGVWEGCPSGRDVRQGSGRIRLLTHFLTPSLIATLWMCCTPFPGYVECCCSVPMGGISGFETMYIFTFTMFCQTIFQSVFKFTWTIPQCNLHFHDHSHGSTSSWILDTEFSIFCKYDKHEMIFLYGCNSLTMCAVKNLSSVYWPPYILSLNYLFIFVSSFPIESSAYFYLLYI